MLNQMDISYDALKIRKETEGNSDAKNVQSGTQVSELIIWGMRTIGNWHNNKKQYCTFSPMKSFGINQGVSN